MFIFILVTFYFEPVVTERNHIRLPAMSLLWDMVADVELSFFRVGRKLTQMAGAKMDQPQVY